ncbi:MAG: hypothetical protein R2716_01100 [Microthrixaceae bacterium]
MHSNLAQGTGGGWRALGENLAKATSVDDAHRLFMNSSSHRSTMLDRRYSQVGIGVAIRGGTYYVGAGLRRLEPLPAELSASRHAAR